MKFFYKIFVIGVAVALIGQANISEAQKLYVNGRQLIEHSPLFLESLVNYQISVEGKSDKELFLIPIQEGYSLGIAYSPLSFIKNTATLSLPPAKTDTKYQLALVEKDLDKSVKIISLHQLIVKTPKFNNRGNSL